MSKTFFVGRPVSIRMTSSSSPATVYRIHLYWSFPSRSLTSLLARSSCASRITSRVAAHFPLCQHQKLMVAHFSGQFLSSQVRNIFLAHSAFFSLTVVPFAWQTVSPCCGHKPPDHLLSGCP